MRYKLYEYKYTYRGNFAYAAQCIEHALDMMGHEKVEDNPDLHVYNHIVRDLEPDLPENSIIFKPTAPTGKHFTIDRMGYANSSSITFDEPFEYEFKKVDPLEVQELQSLIKNKANKWDGSILLKWKDAKRVRDNHILVLGQMPHDQVVTDFSFGDHWTKLKQIIEKLKGRDDVVIKLHPRFISEYKTKDIKRTIERWKEEGHQVFTRYESIHTVLPKTRVAITENSTSGIECLMHGVPVISYGYPEYHWVTKDMRILSRIDNYIDDLSWHDAEMAQKFVHWYIFDHLCSDIDTTMKRLGELL